MCTGLSSLWELCLVAPDTGFLSGKEEYVYDDEWSLSTAVAHDETMLEALRRLPPRVCSEGTLGGVSHWPLHLRVCLCQKLRCCSSCGFGCRKTRARRDQFGGVPARALALARGNELHLICPDGV